MSLGRIGRRGRGIAEGIPSRSLAVGFRTGKTMTNRIVVAALAFLCGQLVAVGELRAESGMAAYYYGGRTASGEVSGPNGLTAAHRTLPFGTRVVVTNLTNGKSVTVRINDRGPYGRGRVIDVSHAAARELGMIGSGTAKVRLDPQ
jgi:rare lipoprotein A